MAKLNKRDSLILVARLSPQFTAAVVDRWQELEAQQPPAVPTDFISAMRLALNQAVMLQEQAPKVEYHDKVLSSKNGMTTTEVAAQAGMSAQKLNKLLQTLHVQKRIGNRWVLTVPHLGQGLAKEVTHADDLGNSRHEMKWKKKRRKFILKLL